MRNFSLVLALLVITLVPVTASGQVVGVFVGPQISGLGIGASAHAKFTQFSVSGEFGIIPINSFDLESDDIEYEIDTKMGGGLLMANFHPGVAGLAFGAGVLIGGYNASGDAIELEGEVEIGDGQYQAVELGTLAGNLDFGGPAPAIMLGRRSGGFNIGVGVAFTGSPKFRLDVTGAIADDPQFQADLEVERKNAQEELNKLPVLPMFRLGWQFGLGI